MVRIGFTWKRKQLFIQMIFKSSTQSKITMMSEDSYHKIVYSSNKVFFEIGIQMSCLKEILVKS